MKEEGILSKGYGIMPNIILFNEGLKDKEKLLYCFISSLCAKEGYCRASNGFLADQLKNKTPKTTLTKQTVSAYVNNLKKNGYLTIEYKFEGKQIIDRKIRLGDIGGIAIGGIKEILDTPKGNPEYPIKEILTDNSTIEYYNNNINTSNKNLKSKTRGKDGIVIGNKIRDHMDIVNEYEKEGTYDINELASKSVLNEYEEEGLIKLGRVFLDYYSGNKDKLKGKVNIKSRFNKFVETDYHNLLKKKAKWVGVNSITDEQFMDLLNQGYFRTAECKFYNEVVRPTLDENGLERFRIMIQFFRNKDIGEKKGLTFNQRTEMKGYNNPKIF